MFEAKTIQRMELLVLSTLNWRMQAVTPFSYVDYFLHKLNGGNATPRSWLFQSAELILCIARGTYECRKIPRMILSVKFKWIKPFCILGLILYM